MIPGILVLNTFWWASKSQLESDNTLRNYTILNTTSFAAGILNNMNQTSKVQAMVDSLIAEDSSIQELTVYKYDGMYLNPLASNLPEQLKYRLSDLDSIPAWQSKSTTFSFAGTAKDGKEVRTGNVTFPILDSNQNSLGLIVSVYTFADSDARQVNTFNLSIIILFAAVTIIVLLLVNYLRLIESSVSLDKLREVDKMKDDFISMASHELRTPLTAIKGFASMLLEGRGASFDESGRHYLEVIMGSTTGLEGLVNEMLDVSRIEQGRLEFRFEPIPVSHAVQQVVDQLQFPANEKGLSLVHQPLDPDLNLNLDASRFRQILFNIIGNAVKYTEAGSVTVSYTQTAKLLTIQVQDTGIGMSEEDAKKLFSKFYRIKTEKTKEITGTGLGLWITKQLIEKMHGHIQLTSKVGEGSVFLISFPKV